MGGGGWMVVGDGWEGGEVGGVYRQIYLHARRREQAPALHWIDVFQRCTIFTQVCVFLRKFHWEVVRKSKVLHPKYGCRGRFPLPRVWGE